MEIADFELERYFARWEFAVEHLLCASDPEPVPMGELLGMADPRDPAAVGRLRLGYTESAGHPLLRADLDADDLAAQDCARTARHGQARRNPGCPSSITKEAAVSAGAPGRET